MKNFRVGERVIITTTKRIGTVDGFYVQNTGKDVGVKFVVVVLVHPFKSQTASGNKRSIVQYLIVHPTKLKSLELENSIEPATKKSYPAYRKLVM